jgi:hypothetical protein
MADGHGTGELFEILFLEDFGDQSHAFPLPDLTTVRNGNTRTLLPSVLKGKKTEKRQSGRFLMPINGKNPAGISGFSIGRQVYVHNFRIVFIAVHNLPFFGNAS